MFPWLLQLLPIQVHGTFLGVTYAEIRGEVAGNDSFIRDKCNHGVACLSGSRQGEGVASDTAKGFSGGNRVILSIPILPCETCETRLSGKMSFICMRTKSHFHINGFAFSLARWSRALRQMSIRLKATGKWPTAFTLLAINSTVSFVDRLSFFGLIL